MSVYVSKYSYKGRHSVGVTEIIWVWIIFCYNLQVLHKNIGPNLSNTLC